MEDYKEKLGLVDSVEYIRKVNYMTQKEMADYLNVCIKTYQGHIKGDNAWTLAEIIKIAELNKYKKFVISNLGTDYEICIKKL